MPRNVLKSAIIAISILFLALAFSGCDLLMNLIGGGPSVDPITIPDSVDADPAYASLESDFLTAINNDRTSASVATFASTDPDLDALARRYAKVGACDTYPENLKNRVALAIGSCSDAAFFLGGSTTLSNYVSTLMSAWLAQPNGASTMRNAGFTKIGIGMTVGTQAGLAPGDTWHSVVVLLAKP